ncbi:unnamed protein product [Amoebophrya sp. A120]|nr:unnamed protein product [Amoebophrya sp. A120]|eukprot:GSA120T00006596001.1
MNRWTKRRGERERLRWALAAQTSNTGTRTTETEQVLREDGLQRCTAARFGHAVPERQTEDDLESVSTDDRSQGSGPPISSPKVHDDQCTLTAGEALVPCATKRVLEEMVLRVLRDEVNLFGLKRLTACEVSANLIERTDLDFSSYLFAPEDATIGILPCHEKQKAQESTLDDKNDSHDQLICPPKSEKRARKLAREAMEALTEEKRSLLLRRPTSLFVYAVLCKRFAIANCLLQACAGNPRVFLFSQQTAEEGLPAEVQAAVGNLLRCKLHTAFASYVFQTLAELISFPGSAASADAAEDYSCRLCGSSHNEILFKCPQKCNEPAAEHSSRQHHFCETCFWSFVAAPAREPLLRGDSESSEAFLCCPWCRRELAPARKDAAPHRCGPAVAPSCAARSAADMSLARFTALPTETPDTLSTYLKKLSNNFTKTVPLSLHETKALNVGCSQQERTKQWIRAVASKDVLRLRALLHAGVDVDARCSEYGATALFRACEENWGRGVRFLLDECGCTVGDANNGLSTAALTWRANELRRGGSDSLGDARQRKEATEITLAKLGCTNYCSSVEEDVKSCPALADFQQKQAHYKEFLEKCNAELMRRWNVIRTVPVGRTATSEGPWLNEAETEKPSSGTGLADDRAARDESEQQQSPFPVPRATVVYDCELAGNKSPSGPVSSCAATSEKQLHATSAFIVDDVFPECFLDALRFIFGELKAVEKMGKSDVCAARRYFSDTEFLIQPWLSYAVETRVYKYDAQEKCQESGNTAGTTVEDKEIPKEEDAWRMMLRDMATHNRTYKNMRFLNYHTAGGAVSRHTDLSRTDAQGFTSTHTFLLYFDVCSTSGADARTERGAISGTKVAMAGDMNTDDQNAKDAGPSEDARQVDCPNGGETRLYLRDSDGFSASGATASGRRAVNNEDEHSGHFHDVSPKNGRLLLFPHDCWHEGLAVVDPPKVLLRGEILLTG